MTEAAIQTKKESIWRGQTWHGRRYLISPFADFMMAGGACLITLCLLLLTVPRDKAHIDPETFSNITILMIALTYVCNHPHFMYSYQIMYGGFFKKIRNLRATPVLLARFWFAAVGVPILLTALLSYIFFTQDTHALGLTINLMVFFVGWHYTKQAYGIFIVLSALKKNYYDAREKKTLLINAYAVWAFTWIQGNIILNAEDFGGFKYYTFDMPDWLLPVVTGLVVGTTAWSIAILYKQAKRTGNRPSITALIGYSSAYYMLALVSILHVAWILIVPFFHSLQYLLFVFSYKRNEARALRKNAADDPKKIKRINSRHSGFITGGFVLGMITFYSIPRVADLAIHYDKMIYGGILFVIFAQLFINIHHYFIDNVIWKKENRDVMQYLFYEG